MAKQKINLTDFLHYHFLSDVRFAPDGGQIAFCVHQADIESNGYHSDVWLADPQTQTLQRLTRDGGCTAFWWHDAKRVAFTHKEQADNQTSVTLMDVQSGAESSLLQLPVKAERIEQIDADHYLVLVLHQLEDENRPPQTEFWEDEDEGYQIYDELPFLENVRGNVNKLRRRLYLYSRVTESLSPLSDPRFEVENFRLSPDGGQLLYFGTAYDTVRGQRHDVLLCDLKTKQQRRLFDGHFVQDVAFWGQQVLIVGTNMQEYGLYQCPSWYVIEPATGALRKLGDSPYAMVNGTSTDVTYGGGQALCLDEEAFYYIATVENYSQLLRTDRAGQTTAVTSLDGAVECFDLHGDRLAYIGLKGQGLTELYLAATDGSGEHQLSSFHSAFLAQKQVCQPQPLSFTNQRGLTIDGWVLAPPDYQAGRKYPGILNIHGGPKGVYGPIFFHEMQLWANQGYFVFFCNPSGSTGRGDAFTDLRGKYGSIDYDDLMDFTDAVLQRYPEIDAQRLGVCGGSYGGFMVNWIIGHTRRFAAAASLRSISNWVSDFGTADIGYFFNVDEHGGDLWDNFDNIWHMSPLKYADQVITPTLIVHSDEDFRCPLTEAYQMYTALRYFGVDSRLVVFQGENHHLSRSGKPRNRVTRMKEILHWFDRHLKAGGVAADAPQ